MLPLYTRKHIPVGGGLGCLRGGKVSRFPNARLKGGGFDVIIGNPPYDVLSELENDTDLTAFRAAIDDEPAYAPSLRGKNNLYKLFVCRALDLLTDGGYLGFITPMANFDWDCRVKAM